MKSHYISYITILLLTLVVHSTYSQTKTGLQIEVHNVQSVQGNIMLAVYKSPETFLTDNIHKGLAVPVTEQGSMIVEIEGIEFGHYSVSVFHDKNQNGQLDTKIFKIPKEPFGFSNDAKGIFWAT